MKNNIKCNKQKVIYHLFHKIILKILTKINFNNNKKENIFIYFRVNNYNKLHNNHKIAIKKMNKYLYFKNITNNKIHLI